MSLIPGMPAATEESLSIVVNGEAVTLPADSTLADLLRAKNIDPASARGVAVAVNDEVVRRPQWTETTLQPDDRVEIVTARQGG